MMAPFDTSLQRTFTSRYAPISNVTRVAASVHSRIFKRCPVRKGDVLFVKDGVNAGTAALNTLDEPFSMLSSVALIRPKVTVLDAKYLVHWLNSPPGYAAMICGRSGSAITRVVLREIRRSSVPLVSLTQQRRIAEVLDRAEALRAKRRAALAQLDTLTQAIFLDLFGDPATNPKGWKAKPLRELVSESLDMAHQTKSQAHGKPALRIPNVMAGLSISRI